jgi:cellulose biosynthesis protein BcsQ
MRERYVLLGLARARSGWFSDVARWANAAVIPAEFVKCVSGEELRARLLSGRPFSAALLDAGLPSVDRDLIVAVRDAGVVPIIVEDRASTRDWAGLGALGVLPAPFDREQLLDLLGLQALPISTAVAVPGEPVDDVESAVGGRVAVVCGPGGTGASTAAIALAQGLAQGGGPTGAQRVLLADLCLTAEQAMLHDARDVVPGVQELVESHRGGRPRSEELLGLTFDITERGYRLLLGLRRRRFWPAIRPRAFEAAFASLRSTFDVVVCDVTADFEGEDATGSIEIEDRNIMARTALAAADVVVVVGEPDMKGLHGLVRLIGEVLETGVEPARLVPVLNQAGRSPKRRAELSAALAQLLTGSGARALASPLFLPARRIEEALRDGVALPAPLDVLLAGAFTAALARAGGPPPSAEPVPVAPGGVGTWTTGVGNRA